MNRILILMCFFAAFPAFSQNSAGVSGSDLGKQLMDGFQQPPHDAKGGKGAGTFNMGGVTIDTTMTTADSSYFPGTADGVAWLAENGGQAALTAAVKGNVDATFACLAAMDGAETVSAYARFNCTVRYDAASDEYIVVVLYG